MFRGTGLNPHNICIFKLDREYMRIFHRIMSIPQNIVMSKTTQLMSFKGNLIELYDGYK